MSDVAFSSFLNDVDSFSLNQIVALMARLTQVLQSRVNPNDAEYLEDKTDYEAAVAAWKEYEKDDFKSYTAEEVFKEAGL